MDPTKSRDHTQLILFIPLLVILLLLLLSLGAGYGKLY